MSDGDDFLGATPDVLLAIGKVVVGAGRLEAITRQIANLLGISDSHRISFSRLTRQIKDRLRTEPNLAVLAALPDAGQLLPWISDAKRLMAERDRRLHNDVVHASIDGAWVPHWVDARTGELTEFDIAGLVGLASALAQHSMPGLEMMRHMAYSVPPGEGWRASRPLRKR